MLDQRKEFKIKTAVEVSSAGHSGIHDQTLIDAD